MTAKLGGEMLLCREGGTAKDGSTLDADTVRSFDGITCFLADDVPAIVVVVPGNDGKLEAWARKREVAE